MLTDHDAKERARTVPVMREVRLRKCVCGKHFECGAHAGACWCAQFPHVIAMPGDPTADCLCPSCLQDRIVRQQQMQQG